MRKIVFAAVLLLSASTIFAQLNFGIKAGYNSSLGLNNLTSATKGDYTLDSIGAQARNNFHVGIFTRIGLGSLYLQPEVLYSMGKKDYNISFLKGDQNVSFNKNVTISTIDIPVLLGYKLLDLKAINLRAFAGPKFRFNAGSSMLMKDPSGITNEDILEEDIKAAKLGLEAGVGIDILMFTLDARYNVIGDLYQTRLNNLTIDRSPANTFVISLGWKIL